MDAHRLYLVSKYMTKEMWLLALDKIRTSDMACPGVYLTYDIPSPDPKYGISFEFESMSKQLRSMKIFWSFEG